MTTVVTGASGHLGGNLLRALDDDDIRAVVHRDTRAIDGLDVNRVSASLGDPSSLRKAFRGADTVFHLAAAISINGDPTGMVRATNVVGARNVAQAALDEKVRRFVHVSSVHAFDLRSAEGPVDEAHTKSGPKNYDYDYSKSQGEDQVRAVVAKGLDAVIVNPTGVVGPFDFKPSRMGQVFLDLAHQRLPAVITGAFDFVDVRDVVASAMAARDKGITGENYLLGGRRLSVRDIATEASKATGVKAPRMTIPSWLAMAGIPFAALSARRTKTDPKFTAESLGALRHCPMIDHSKASRDLGHKPRPISETVQDVYDWFKQAGMWQP